MAGAGQSLGFAEPGYCVGRIIGGLREVAAGAHWSPGEGWTRGIFLVMNLVMFGHVGSTDFPYVQEFALAGRTARRAISGQW
ncbi:MAG: hypothetical protein QGF71_02150 [Rhodospirillales bacterium]|nr:hypothetical protein [Rhodospirillales bacterium]